MLSEKLFSARACVGELPKPKESFFRQRRSPCQNNNNKQSCLLWYHTHFGRIYSYQTTKSHSGEYPTTNIEMPVPSKRPRDPHHAEGSSSASAGRTSFQDYHLIVDDGDGDEENVEHDAAVVATTTPSIPTLEQLLTSPTTPSLRRQVYSANDEVYFDEDPTLPSREEPLHPTSYEEYYATPGGDATSASYRSRRRSRGGSSLLTTAVPALGRKNYLNVLTYVLHLFVSWGIGIWGLNGILETRWQITTRYESLVTPAPWAYHLWFPILFLEGVFATAQLLPYFRNRPIIQDGIGYFFFYTFVLQTAWTLFFSFQLFIGSFISVVLALLSLLSLLLSQLHTCTTTSDLRPRSWGGEEYWLFRFPFYLHTGWMVLMAVDHFALLFRAYSNVTTSLQVAIDIVSLALMLAFGVACLIRPPYQDFCIPLVILWSFVSMVYSIYLPVV